MKIKMIINTMQMEDHGLNRITRRSAEVWSGELNILPDGEYVTKISIIADGYEHPICDIPFSPMEGYWSWHSGEYSDNTTDRME